MIFHYHLKNGGHFQIATERRPWLWWRQVSWRTMERQDGRGSIHLSIHKHLWLPILWVAYTQCHGSRGRPQSLSWRNSWSGGSYTKKTLALQVGRATMSVYTVCYGRTEGTFSRQEVQGRQPRDNGMWTEPLKQVVVHQVEKKECQAEGLACVKALRCHHMEHARSVK